MSRVLPAACLLVCLAGQARSAGAMSRAGRLALAPLRYVGRRAQDLLDVFELNASAGRSVKIDVRYGVQLFGYADDLETWRVGLMDRRAGTWREIDSEIALFPLSYLAWPIAKGAEACGWRQAASDVHFVYEAGTEGVQHLDRKELNGDVAFFWKDTVSGHRHTRWGDSFPIGVEAHLGVGVRAVVRPLQLADFVVGFVGLDLDPWLNREP